MYIAALPLTPMYTPQLPPGSAHHDFRLDRGPATNHAVAMADMTEPLLPPTREHTALPSFTRCPFLTQNAYIFFRIIYVFVRIHPDRTAERGGNDAAMPPHP